MLSVCVGDVMDVVFVTISCYYIFTCLLNMMNPT